MTTHEINAARILRIWKSLRRSFTAAFHNIAIPPQDRLDLMAYRYRLLRRANVLMVKYGHLHPDCLNDRPDNFRKSGKIKGKQ